MSVSTDKETLIPWNTTKLYNLGSAGVLPEEQRNTFHLYEETFAKIEAILQLLLSKDYFSLVNTTPSAPIIYGVYENHAAVWVFDLENIDATQIDLLQPLFENHTLENYDPHELYRRLIQSCFDCFNIPVVSALKNEADGVQYHLILPFKEIRELRHSQISNRNDEPIHFDWSAYVLQMLEAVANPAYRFPVARCHPDRPDQSAIVILSQDTTENDGTFIPIGPARQVDRPFNGSLDLGM